MRVRYYGNVGVASGYGAAANEFCMAMLAAGIDLEIQTAGRQLHKRYAALGPCIRDDAHPPTPDPDVVIVHTLPLSCAKMLDAAKVTETCPDALLVAYTTWEGLWAPTELLESLEPFDQVWVPSQRTRSAIDHSDLFRTCVVPHAVDDRPVRVMDRLYGHAPDPSDLYRFYTIGAWTARKNPEGVIRAYLRAFNKGENVSLHVHASGASPSAATIASIAATGKPPAELPSITFSHDHLADEEVALLHETNDCFVSASRGESWSIPAFDAMLSGRFIIATDALGHDEFLGETNYWRVPSVVAPATGEIRMQNVGGATQGQYVGGDCLTVKQSWRDPSISEIAHLMRRAVKERPRLSIDYDPIRFGRSQVGDIIKRLLEQAVTR